jgi:hypothetical protein
LLHSSSRVLLCPTPSERESALYQAGSIKANRKKKVLTHPSTLAGPSEEKYPDVVPMRAPPLQPLKPWIDELATERAKVKRLEQRISALVAKNASCEAQLSKVVVPAAPLGQLVNARTHLQRTPSLISDVSDDIMAMIVGILVAERDVVDVVRLSSTCKALYHLLWHLQQQQDRTLRFQEFISIVGSRGICSDGRTLLCRHITNACGTAWAACGTIPASGSIGWVVRVEHLGSIWGQHLMGVCNEDSTVAWGVYPEPSGRTWRVERQPNGRDTRIIGHGRWAGIPKLADRVRASRTKYSKQHAHRLSLLAAVNSSSPLPTYLTALSCPRCTDLRMFDSPLCTHCPKPSTASIHSNSPKQRIHRDSRRCRSWHSFVPS